MRAASCTSLMMPSVFGLFEFTITPACRTISDSSSSRLGINSSMRKLTPVRLPPGWARLATRPAATGSPPIMETIGIVEVALFAASDERSPPLAAIPSTLRPTGSAANAGRRSWRFSAQRKDRYVILSDRLLARGGRRRALRAGCFPGRTRSTRSRHGNSTGPVMPRRKWPSSTSPSRYTRRGTSAGIRWREPRLRVG